jgi:hypothetical protein
MAIVPPNSAWDDPTLWNVEVKDYPIGGKMVYVSLQVDGEILSKEHDAEIKKHLTAKLLHAMIEAKCIEFTKASEYGGHTYRARCFVTPDDQIRIIRTHSPRIK